MASKIKNYINGKWIETKGTEYLDVINPATSECLARVPAGSREDVDYGVTGRILRQ